jgi:hypothetical protein
MEVSGQLHTLATLTPWKESTVLTAYKAGWFLKLIWMWWQSEKSFPLLGIKRAHYGEIISNKYRVLVVLGIRYLTSVLKILHSRPTLFSAYFSAFLSLLPHIC